MSNRTVHLRLYVDAIVNTDDDVEIFELLEEGELELKSPHVTDSRATILSLDIVDYEITDSHQGLSAQENNYEKEIQIEQNGDQQHQDGVYFIGNNIVCYADGRVEIFVNSLGIMKKKFKAAIGKIIVSLTLVGMLFYIILMEALKCKEKDTWKNFFWRTWKIGKTLQNK